MNRSLLERGGESILFLSLRGVNCMAPKTILDKLLIYIPQSKIGQKPVEQLVKLGSKRDRSVNYLVVQAILQ